MSSMGRWLLPAAVVTPISVAVGLGIPLEDYTAFNSPEAFASLPTDANAGRYVLVSIARSLAVVLGITIMGVLLAVHLAAARYSLSLAQLYIEDRINIAFLSLFVVSIAYTLWAASTTNDNFVPTPGSLPSLVLVTACFVSLIPYVRHVFNFLEPEVIVSKLERKALEAVRPGNEVKEADKRFTQWMNQIGRIAANSASQMESDVAVSAVKSLERLIHQYLKIRSGAADTQIRPVELTSFNLLNRVFTLALNKARDVTYEVARSARSIAEEALKVGRGEIPRSSLLFLNRMLHAGISEKDGVTISHLLYQYRLLAEALLTHCDERLLEVVSYLKSYALAAQASGIRGVVDTVAYDLNILCQKTWTCGSPLKDQLMESFLDMEPYLQRNGQAAAVFPVRKMYGVLAAHLLANGAESLAQPFVRRLTAMPEEELARLREQLFTPVQPCFWEFTERKANFDYLGEREKDCLRPFVFPVQPSNH